MSLTATQVMNFFELARRHGRTAINNTCDCCGRKAASVGLFATAYRERELIRRHPDPGNICSVCAVRNDRIIGDIIDEVELSEH